VRLYTICIDQRPILVVSAGASPPMEDGLLTSHPELAKTISDLHAMNERMPEEEIDSALEGWLGEELQALMHQGAPLWSGDRSSLHVREARLDELLQWASSLQRAIDAGEQDAGNGDWGFYLVDVTPDDGPEGDEPRLEA
jgi:hypothetical protein